MIVVEVLGRGGRVEERVRLAQLPAVLGRGAGSEVVLDDPYAEAAHARISEGEGGTLLVEDLGSTNGITAGEHGVREPRLVLRPGAVFRVGHTLLRLRTADMALAPALRDTASDSRWHRLIHRRAAAVLLTALGAPLGGLLFFLGESDKTGVSEYATDVIGAAGFLLAWAAVWALGARIRGGRANFGAHLVTGWLVLGLGLVVTVADEWLRFFTAGTWIAGAATTILGIAIVTTVIYGHLSVSSRLAPARRLLAGLGVTAAVFAFAALGAGDALRNRHNDIVIDMPLKPVPAGMVPAETADEFLARAAKLQQAVDKAAEPD